LAAAEQEKSIALKRPKGPSGTLVVLEHTSEYDEGRGRRFPVLYDLVGSAVLAQGDAVKGLAMVAFFGVLPGTGGLGKLQTGRW